MKPSSVALAIIGIIGASQFAAPAYSAKDLAPNVTPRPQCKRGKFKKRNKGKK